MARPARADDDCLGKRINKEMGLHIIFQQAKVCSASEFAFASAKVGWLAGFSIIAVGSLRIEGRCCMCLTGGHYNDIEESRSCV